MDDEYRIKDITFQGSSRRILLQSKNGPCPLLALANVLLLRNQMKIPLDTRYATLDNVLHLITNLLLDLNANISLTESNCSTSAAFRGNFEGCLNVLPNLHAGMDVNVQFRSIDAFEFTQELGIFDLLDIRLLHGWVVSEQDRVMHDLLGHESYNTVVERIFRLQDDDASVNDKHEAALLRHWLDETCSQLTFDGLLQLHEGMRDRELAILFRNSHFSTIFKHDSKLFLLNTDIGFKSSNLIWEQLDELDGDTNYVGHDFCSPTATTANASAHPSDSGNREVLHTEYPLADPITGFIREFSGSDEELARHLFYEEQARAKQLAEIPALLKEDPTSSEKPHGDIQADTLLRQTYLPDLLRGQVDRADTLNQQKSEQQQRQQQPRRQQQEQQQQQRQKQEDEEKEEQEEKRHRQEAVRANQPDITEQQRPAATSRAVKKKSCCMQ